MMLVSSYWMVLVLAVVAVLVAGAHRASLRAGESPPEARSLAAKVALGIGAWLTVLALLAGAGFFSRFDARPPRLLFGVFGAVGISIAISRSSRFRKLLLAAPPTWPIAIQTMRVPIELGLWALFLEARLPEHLTFEGRNFDVFVGLTAPAVAYAVRHGVLGTRGVVLWNVASIGVLANIVGMAVTSIPGPLHLDWPGVPNTIVAEFPYVWLPGFLVPLALFGHVTSLRQLRLFTGPGLTSSPRSSESRSSSPSTTRRAVS